MHKYYNDNTINYTHTYTDESGNFSGHSKGTEKKKEKLNENGKMEIFLKWENRSNGKLNIKIKIGN